MANVELGRFRGRLRIGSKGDVRISGEGVLERHAEISAASDGSEWVRSTGGEVWVERRGLRELVTRPRRLVDGDVIVIGNWRLDYRNLAARRERSNGTRTSWMR